jgi:transcription elongation factor GreA
MAKGKKITYTQQGYQQLVDELQYLRVEKREKIKNDIAVARSFGDLSENAEYEEARNEQGKNEARIAELEALLENAQILDESTIDTSVVSLGSTVKILHMGMGKELVYDLVGSNESNPAEGKISDQAPIGAALIGKRAGDEVSVVAPNGTFTLKVLEVSRTQA